MTIKDFRDSILDEINYNCLSVDAPAMKREVADELDKFFGNDEWFLDFHGDALRNDLRSTVQYYCKDAWPNVEVLIDQFFGDLKSQLTTLCKETFHN